MFYYFNSNNDHIVCLCIGKTTPTYESNCRELIKIVDDFLSQSSSDDDERLTDNLVNGMFIIELNQISVFFCM